MSKPSDAGIYTPESGDHTRLFDHWDEQNKSLDTILKTLHRAPAALQHATVLAGSAPGPNSRPVTIYGHQYAQANQYGYSAFTVPGSLVGIGGIQFQSFTSTYAAISSVTTTQIISLNYLPSGAQANNATVRFAWQVFGWVNGDY